MQTNPDIRFVEALQRHAQMGPWLCAALAIVWLLGAVFYTHLHLNTLTAQLENRPWPKPPETPKAPSTRWVQAQQHQRDPDKAWHQLNQWVARQKPVSGYCNMWVAAEPQTKSSKRRPKAPAPQWAWRCAGQVWAGKAKKDLPWPEDAATLRLMRAWAPQAEVTLEQDLASDRGLARHGTDTREPMWSASPPKPAEGWMDTPMGRKRYNPNTGRWE